MHQPALQVGPCGPWGAVLTPPAPAEGPGLGAFPRDCCSPPEMWHSGSVLICFHPISARSQSQCEKPPRLSSEIGPRAPGEGDQMSRFHQQRQPWEGNRQAIVMPRSASVSCADGQLGNPAPVPSHGRCRSAKSAAVSKRQNLSQAMRLAIKGSGRGSGPAEAPQEQWQSFGSRRRKAGQRRTLPPNSSCCLSTNKGGANLVSFT